MTLSVTQKSQKFADMTIRVYLCAFVFTNFLRVSAYFCVTLSKTQKSTQNHFKIQSIMATKKNMARTAKKRATIIAMAAIAGASVSQTSAAARQALADMREELGKDTHVYSLNYTWDPFDGMLA